MTEEQLARAMIALPIAIPLILSEMGLFFWFIAVTQEGGAEFMERFYRWMVKEHGKTNVLIIALLCFSIPAAMMVSVSNMEESAEQTAFVMLRAAFVFGSFLTFRIWMFCRSEYPQYLLISYWRKTKKNDDFNKSEKGV